MPFSPIKRTPSGAEVTLAPGSVGSSEVLLSPSVSSINNDYLSWIEQYKGTQYYDLLKNNPFLLNEFDYTPSWWERNVEQGLFDDYSRQNNFMSDKRQSLYEEAYKILGSKTADDLNSPLNKVSKDKLAGINSDLVGTQTPDSAISPGTDETSPAHPADLPIFSERLTQVAGLTSSFFQGLMQFGSFYKDMESKTIKNTMDDVLTSKTAYDTVLEFLAGNEHFQVGDDGKVLPLDEDTFVELQDTLVSAFGNSALTKRGKALLKYMRGRVSYDKEGKPTLAYQSKRSEMIAKYLGNQMQSAKVASSKAYDDDLLQFIAKYRTEFQSITDAATQAIEKAKKAAAERQTATDVTPGLGSAEGSALKAAAERQTAIDLIPGLGSAEGSALKAKAGYESSLYGATYEGESLGKAEGEARVVAAQKSRASGVMDKKIDETFAALQKKLDQDKSPWGILGSILLPLLHAKVKQLIEFNPMNLLPALL